MNFRIICSKLCGKCHGYFDRHCIKFVDCCEQYGHFNSILLIHEGAIAFPFFVSSSVSFMSVYSFQSISLSRPWLSLFLYIFLM